MKKPITILFGSLLILVVILYLGLSFYITELAFQAKRNFPEKTPNYYHLEFEEVTFKSTDKKEILLKGWWIPTKSEIGTIIWLHGLDGSRSGNKMDMINEMNKLGYSILTFDFRGHGVSGDAPLGLGIREKNDVYGALDFLKNEKGIEKVGLFGTSYGAVIAIDSALNLEPNSTDIVGAFVDSPYFYVTELMAKEVSDRTPIPESVASLLRYGIIWGSKILKQIDITEIPISMSKNANLEFPIVIVHCTNDERIPVSHSEKIFLESKKNSEFYKFNDCEEHGKAYESNKQAYMNLLDKYFKSQFIKD